MEFHTVTISEGIIKLRRGGAGVEPIAWLLARLSYARQVLDSNSGEAFKGTLCWTPAARINTKVLQLTAHSQ